jgi:capsular polysaccharide biosynthesis protein
MGRPAKYTKKQLADAIANLQVKLCKHEVGEWVEVKGLNYQTQDKLQRAANNAAVRHLVALGEIEKHPTERCHYRLVNDKLREQEKEQEAERRANVSLAESFAKKIYGKIGAGQTNDIVVQKDGSVVISPFMVENLYTFLRNEKKVL